MLFLSYTRLLKKERFHLNENGEVRIPRAFRIHLKLVDNLQYGHLIQAFHHIVDSHLSN